MACGRAGGVLLTLRECPCHVAALACVFSLFFERFIQTLCVHVLWWRGARRPCWCGLCQLPGATCLALVSLCLAVHNNVTVHVCVCGAGRGVVAVGLFAIWWWCFFCFPGAACVGSVRRVQISGKSACVCVLLWAAAGLRALAG